MRFGEPSAGAAVAPPNPLVLSRVRSSDPLLWFSCYFSLRLLNRRRVWVLGGRRRARV